MTCDVALVMTVKCDATKRPAGKPATGPNAADTTGTFPIASAITAKRCGSTVGVPAGLRFAGVRVIFETLPPPPSRSRMGNFVVDGEVFSVDAFTQPSGIWRATLERGNPHRL